MGSKISVVKYNNDTVLTQKFFSSIIVNDKQIDSTVENDSFEIKSNADEIIVEADEANKRVFVGISNIIDGGSF